MAGLNPAHSQLEPGAIYLGNQLVFPFVDLNQQIAGLDNLILCHDDLLDLSGDLG